MDSTASDPWVDPVIKAYERDVDRTLLRENLRRSVDERFAKLQQMMQVCDRLQRAMRVAQQQA